jgi:pimeloyl-ACP methyl ester carboxylesterase
MMQDLARYWATDYDWRRCEARLNDLPHFLTEVDGLDIHFIHVRSKHEDALPLVINHGWPGSFIEQLKIIDRLTNPTAHGGRAQDAFDVVIPSMPGYGFSAKPTSPGWGPERMARAWAELMTRLGCTRYVAQGGDWGAFVVDQMGLQAPTGLLAIHTNMPATVQADVNDAAQAGDPPPSDLSAEERRAYEQLIRTFGQVEYARYMAARPQTLYGIADSPVGLAAWLLDHNDADGQPAAVVVAALERTASTHRRTDPRRGPRQHHALLADQHRSVGVSALLGIQRWILQRQGRLHPRGRDRLPWRAISGDAKVGRARVSQPHLLQRSREGRPLRRVGAARTLLRRDPSRIHIAMVTAARGLRGSCARSRTMTAARRGGAFDLGRGVGMQVEQVLSILAVPGRAQDERVWGDLLPRLRSRYRVVLLADPYELAHRSADVILACADAASAAVHAARNGRGRAVVLLAPLVNLAILELPELNVDLGRWAWTTETAEMFQLAEELRAIEDPEQRRAGLADGFIRVIGREIPSADAARLRAMVRDSADVIEDPTSLAPIYMAPYADELRALELPLLILAAGRDDRAVAIARALAERAPRSELVLLETAQPHYPWLAQPAAAAEALLQFLARI